MAYWLYRCFLDSCQEREMQEATQQVFNDFLERSLEVLPRLLLRTLQIWVYQILHFEVWVEFLLSQNGSNFLEVQPLQEGGRKLKLFEETPEGWEKQLIRGNRLKVLVLGHKILKNDQAVSIWQLVPEATGSDDGWESHSCGFPR